MPTTFERVADLRREFDSFAEPVIFDQHAFDPTIKEKVCRLLVANSKLPHSRDQQELQNDLLDFYLTIKVKDKVTK